ncbi:ergothioneine biosynthesis glutamate--cysteine ligase EgtA [Sphaerisporangium rubeum]|uniref:Glutamate--cysteine ligase EgtA n=1 Tax=Sphaerisporangium rubeum TaxID=321317 RepID=A0A7X0IFX2_9ACTN|nr:glutamate-cysteine ligase family protein [Sphaerisporangium rubeum]MBB6474510.1 glutamate--cysteine ligase [Sphaerisporangium rubeum]
MTSGLTQDVLIRDAAGVEEFARECFAAVAGEERVGAELEFLVYDRRDPARPVPVGEVVAALPELPGGSRVTFEPGGQLELSGPPGTLTGAVRRLGADVEAVRAALLDAGLAPAGVGLDPVRPPVRQLTEPRYEAMARHFGAPYGPLMMCSTASIQVNLDLGAAPEVRWERAHLLGPVLVAAFANSPLGARGPTGWMSGRQEVWENLDRTRTAPVPAAADPAAAWAAYLLDARLMVLRDGDGRCRQVRDGTTLRDRIAATGVTKAEVAYHATTVFPPVRPRGWLEIRYLDAQSPAVWPVCVAVTHALITDDKAAGAACAAAEPCRGLWRTAARDGLAGAPLRRAAQECFHAALDALPRLGAHPGLIRAVADFADRHVTPGRSPAAALLDGPPIGTRLMEGHL